MISPDTILDAPGVRDALGEGDDLTSENVRLLAILLDPKNDPSAYAETIADRLEEFSGETFGADVYDAELVADTLRTHIARTTGRFDEFEFELIYAESDGYTSYNVLTRAEGDFWLMLSSESKYLFAGRYNLAGLRGALHIAETILGDHTRLVAKRDRLIRAQTA